MKKFTVLSILILFLVVSITAQDNEMIVVVEKMLIETSTKHYSAAAGRTTTFIHKTMLQPGGIIIFLDSHKNIVRISYESPDLKKEPEKILITKKQFEELKRKFAKTLTLANRYQKTKEYKKMIQEFQKHLKNIK